MSAARHTPGPWEYDDGYIQQAGVPDLGIVNLMNLDEGGDKDWYRGPVTMANAALIAAAPDMLLALRRAALALAFAAESSPAMRDDYTAVSNAITKATTPPARA